MQIYILAELDSTGEDVFTAFKNPDDAESAFLIRKNMAGLDYAYDVHVNAHTSMLQINPYARLCIKTVDVDEEAPFYHLVVGFNSRDDIVYISAHPTEEEANKKIVSVTRDLAAEYKDNKFLKRTSDEIIFNENTVRTGTDYIVFETFETEE